MIAAVMPVRGRVDLTEAMLGRLAGEEIERILILDNDEHGTAGQFAGEKVHVVGAAGLNIHQMWNRGWDLAAGASAVWFVNNDIDFCPGTARMLADVLEWAPIEVVYPDYDRRVADGIVAGHIRATAGTYRVGGLCGWCFMVREDLSCRFDEQFGWWYGDDDFVRQIEAGGGRVGRLEGVPVDHLQEATAQDYPHLHEQKQRDAERYAAKWAA